MMYRHPLAPVSTRCHQLRFCVTEVLVSRVQQGDAKDELEKVCGYIICLYYMLCICLSMYLSMYLYINIKDIYLSIYLFA